MKARTRHALYWLAWVAAFGGYELYAYRNDEPGDTLSENVWALLMIDGVGPVLTALALGFLAWLTFHFIAPAIWHHGRQWKDRRTTPTTEATMFVPAKKALKSKTLWFNLVGLVILAAEYLQALELGEPAMQAIGLVLVLGNGILRMLTKQPVSIRGKGGEHLDAAA